jgi:hypothetical protein
MAEVRDIVTAALRELGVLAAGEVATADEANSGLEELNRLVDQWAGERLLIYRVTRTTWTISATQNYTVGAGGTVNVVRPVYLDHVNLIDTSTDPDQETPLTPLTDDGWAAITQKASTSTQPTNWYYNPTFPLGTLSLWPVPSSATLQGALYAPQQTSEFASLEEVISLPPGYRRMLVKNLARDLAPSYDRPVHPELKEEAIESKATVKRNNYRPSDLSFDAAVLGGSGNFDINTGR